MNTDFLEWCRSRGQVDSGTTVEPAADPDTSVEGRGWGDATGGWDDDMDIGAWRAERVHVWDRVPREITVVLVSSAGRRAWLYTSGGPGLVHVEDGNSEVERRETQAIREAAMTLDVLHINWSHNGGAWWGDLPIEAR